MEKPCTKCGVVKPLESFPKQKRNRDGRDSRCKVCAAIQVADYAARNPEKVKATQRAAYLKNKDKYDARITAWHQANKEQRAEHRKRWRDKNHDLARHVERLSVEKSRPKILERKRAYAKANRAKTAAYAQKRKAAKLRAIPAWVDLAKIEAIYKECQEMTRTTGIPHHVDHIYPLQSPVVCGLHVHNNLRILDADSNRRKFNKLLDLV